MISLAIADLVLIAGRTLRLDTSATLDVLDVAAAEAALAEAALAGAWPGADVATGAAGLLHALIREHPMRYGNERVAVVATLQFLGVNGWQADLDPPEAASAVIAALTAGSMAVADLAAWLSPRLSPHAGPGRSGTRAKETRAKEVPMRGRLRRRKRPARTMGLLFQRFTDQARQVLVAAQEEARAHNHSFIGTEHILLGLLREGDGVAAMALQSLGVGLEAVREQVVEIIGRGKQAHSGHIPFTPRAKKVLELSLREAMRLDHLYVGTEHILLGLVRQGDGVAVLVLEKLGARSDQIRGAVFEQIRGAAVDLMSGRGPVPRGAVLPPGLGLFDEKVALVRQQKDAAIDSRDFDQAAALRDSEKRLLAERAQRIADWSAGVDVAALGEELGRMHREVGRLQALLLQHGIEPGDGNQQSA